MGWSIRRVHAAAQLKPLAAHGEQRSCGASIRRVHAAAQLKPGRTQTACTWPSPSAVFTRRPN